MRIDKIPRPYDLPRYVPNKDRPYIEFYAWSIPAESKVRKRVYHPPKFRTPHLAARWKRANMQTIERLLKAGYVFESFPPENPPAAKMEREKPWEMVARQKAERTQGLGEAGTHNPAGIPLLVHPAVCWAAEMRSREVGQRTREANTNVCKRLREFLDHSRIPDLHLSEFTKAHANMFSNYLMEIRQVSAKTRNNYMGFIQSLFSALHEVGGIKENPFDNFRKIKHEESTRNAALTAEQASRMLDWMEANDTRLLFVCKLIYYTFARPIELYRLKVGDIDLVAEVIHLSSSVTKARKAQQINLTGSAVRMLAAYLDGVTDKNLYLIGKGGRPSKARIGEETMARYHREALKALGLDGIGVSLYSWKHTGVCAAFDAGMSLEDISAACRHSNLSMTEIYLRNLRKTRPKQRVSDW